MLSKDSALRLLHTYQIEQESAAAALLACCRSKSLRRNNK